MAVTNTWLEFKILDLFRFCVGFVFFFFYFIVVLCSFY